MNTLMKSCGTPWKRWITKSNNVHLVFKIHVTITLLCLCVLSFRCFLLSALIKRYSCWWKKVHYHMCICVCVCACVCRCVYCYISFLWKNYPLGWCLGYILIHILVLMNINRFLTTCFNVFRILITDTLCNPTWHLLILCQNIKGKPCILIIVSSDTQ